MTSIQTMSDAERIGLAAQAYIYGYPLVYSLREIAGFAEAGAACR